MLQLGYPLELNVVEARGVYDAEADEKYVLSTKKKVTRGAKLSLSLSKSKWVGCDVVGSPRIREGEGEYTGDTKAVREGPQLYLGYSGGFVLSHTLRST